MIFGGIRHKMPLLVETNSSQVAYYDLLVAESYTQFLLVLERNPDSTPHPIFPKEKAAEKPDAMETDDQHQKENFEGVGPCNI